VEKKRESELTELISAEGLHPEETRAYVTDALRDGFVKSAGTGMIQLLPAASRFSPSGEHGKKKQRVFELLTEFIARYFGLG
jgi:type I restriction enzyme R subunit